MSTIEYVFVVVFLLLAVLFCYKLFQSLFYRYFGSYDKFIGNYLSENQLSLITTTIPSKEDWINAPFEVPSKVEVSLVQIRVLGMPVDFRTKKYRLILAKSNDGKINRIWLEIRSELFGKPKFKFSNE